MAYAEFLSWVLGCPSSVPIRNRMMSALSLSSLAICVGLDISAWSLGLSSKVHLVLGATFVFYLLLFYFCRKSRKPVLLIPWIWFVIQVVIVLFDWRYMSGVRGISILLAVCVIFATPVFLRGIHAVIAIGAMVCVLLSMLFVELEGLTPLTALPIDDAVLIDMFVSAIVLALGLSLIMSLIIFSHTQQQRMIEGLNMELEKRNKVISEDNVALEELNRMKNSLFSIIGHDLRNPIGGLSSISDMLVNNKGSFSKQEVEELHHMMSLSSESALQLLNNLLLWARSESGTIVKKKEKILIAALVDESIQLLQLLADQKAISIRNTCSGEHCIFGDQEMLKTVFRNMINNAIKFTPENGLISINSTLKEDQLEIRIIDNGVGMSEEEAKQILSKSDTFSKKGTKDESGSGLGFKLSKNFVEQNGGRIEVISRIGEGTTVSMTFPARD